MKIKVGVFFGGRSVEHEVSIITAIQAIDALDKEKYEVIPIYISKKCELYTGDLLLEIESYNNIDELLKECRKVAFINENGTIRLVENSNQLFGKRPAVTIDIAFPIVHGANVEDGTLQGYFETLGIPYVGSDVLASAIGMDKYISKAVLKSKGIPVLDSYTANFYQYAQNKQDVIDAIEGDFNYPVIVKPMNLGSSVGISIANSTDELVVGLDHAFEFSNKLLIEKVVKNLREINCSVIGDLENATASVCEEPVNTGNILSYADKYLNGGKNSGMASAKRLIPAPLDDALTESIQDIAVKTFKIIGCNGVVRIDFLIDADDDTVYVNEINTIPGSLAFYLWEASGKPFTAMLDELIRLALKREREKNSIKNSFETNILSGFIARKGSKFGGSKG